MSSSENPLSSRAEQAKQSMKKMENVKAVVIPPDSEPKEISYNTSSKQANKILNGRPTIIGELEQIQVVIVRSLNQKNCGPLNKNILPVPFCNKSYNGNYLLYRIDAQGNAKDFTLSEYTSFVQTNKKLTEQAQKNYNPIDGQEIGHNKSPFGSNSGLTMVYLQSEVDKQIRADFKKENGRNPTDSEIEVSVHEAVTKLVNDLTSESSPMNDPDYNPDDDDSSIIGKLKQVYYDENGVEIKNEELLKTLRKGAASSTDNDFDDLSDQRDWRLQLKDALNYVRQRGRADGRALAQRISSTFYELNGVEPSLNELVDVFRRIKTDLADEAMEDMEHSGQPLETQQLAQKLAAKMTENPDPTEVVDMAQKIVATNLMTRAKAMFKASKGRSPNKQELRENINKLAMQFAEKAVLSIDGDYDPTNAADQKQAKIDELDDRQFDGDSFDLKMYKTKSKKSKNGKSEGYDIYFGDALTKDRMAKNLKAAMASFEMRNKSKPNAFHIHGIEKFLATDKDTKLIQFKLSQTDKTMDHDDDEKESMESKAKVLITPVKEKKSSAVYNVYFDDKQEKNEDAAIKWFARFNNRKPTAMELKRIQQFIKHDKSELIECEFDLNNFEMMDDCKMKEEDDDDNKLLKMKTSFAVKKEKATMYTLDFVDEEMRVSGNEKAALKWFEIFNKRKPNKDEQTAISNFVKADMNDQMINID